MSLIEDEHYFVSLQSYRMRLIPIQMKLDLARTEAQNNNLEQSLLLMKETLQLLSALLTESIGYISEYNARFGRN